MNTNPIESLDLRQLGYELRRARKQRGLRQEDAAKLIHVARTTLVAIENGERKIRSEELVELARAYGKQVSDFLRSRPTIPLQDVQFRGPPTKREEHQELVSISISYFEDLCRNYLELERITGSENTRRYPVQYERKGSNLDLEAETLAQTERDRLGLGHAPLPPLRDILEQDIGIKVFYLSLKPSTFSGIYYYSDELGACMAINSNHEEDRCRWTMAHDLCHFIADRLEPTVLFTEGYQRRPASERFADAFAKYFLMPTSSVTQRYQEIYSQQNKITLHGLCILANRFGVSVEAITRRLEDLRLMKTGAWDRIKERKPQIRELQKELELESIPGRRDMYPLHYREMAYAAYRSGKISEGRFAVFLGINQIEARAVATDLRRQNQDSDISEDAGNSEDKWGNDSNG